MKYLKTNEQYHTDEKQALLKWAVLNFLLRRSEECSIEEILSNFPTGNTTKEALIALTGGSFASFDESSGKYKATKYGLEHLKIIQKLQQ
ncbi:MAG: hypothetical protein RLZZ71_1076 [Bacteroidota bacterium]|jgi:hypothetical protein